MDAQIRLVVPAIEQVLDFVSAHATLCKSYNTRACVIKFEPVHKTTTQSSNPMPAINSLRATARAGDLPRVRDLDADATRAWGGAGDSYSISSSPLVAGGEGWEETDSECDVSAIELDARCLISRAC